MPLAEHRIGFVGAGNMAEAIVRGLLAAGAVQADHILVSDVRSDRLDLFAALGVPAFPENLRPASEADILVLSVKPQVMADVLRELSAHVGSDTIVVSIAAGISTGFIEARLGDGARVVRVMPNTPLLVGKGMSALVPGRHASPEDISLVSGIFASCGSTVIIKDETLMDAVTAVSGSGPAYLFYLAEAMLLAAETEGLPAETSDALVRETLAGAGALLAASRGAAPDELRRRVSSPGGTTEAAIKSMDEAGVSAAIMEAVRRAAARSRELAKG
ncbi:MAG TPA: pyrroline-5-carboxylate reductase [Planctomycetes bacterium]|nr:pyrroline-5-carboxylate reductase [Planctomycetota bacterium]